MAVGPAVCCGGDSPVRRYGLVYGIDLAAFGYLCTRLTDCTNHCVVGMGKAGHSRRDAGSARSEGACTDGARRLGLVVGHGGKCSGGAAIGICGHPDSGYLGDCGKCGCGPAGVPSRFSVSGCAHGRGSAARHEGVHCHFYGLVDSANGDTHLSRGLALRLALGQLVCRGCL